MKNEESRIQQGCVRWFRYQYPNLSRLLLAVPNGGRRDKVTASILKAEGVVAGVSDLILLIPSQGYHALCIEMKTAHGRQSPEQKEWQQAVTDAGYKYIVCRNVDDFIESVNTYIKGEQDIY